MLHVDGVLSNMVLEPKAHLENQRPEDPWSQDPWRTDPAKACSSVSVINRRLNVRSLTFGVPEPGLRAFAGAFAARRTGYFSKRALDPAHTHFCYRAARGAGKVQLPGFPNFMGLDTN